jgi:hypothetical protein
MFSVLLASRIEYILDYITQGWQYNTPTHAPVTVIGTLMMKAKKKINPLIFGSEVSL